MHNVNWKKDDFSVDVQEYIDRSAHTLEKTKEYLDLIGLRIRNLSRADSLDSWAHHSLSLGRKVTEGEKNQIRQDWINELNRLKAALVKLPSADTPSPPRWPGSSASSLL